MMHSIKMAAASALKRCGNLKLHSKLVIIFSAFITIPIIVLGVSFLSFLGQGMHTYEESALLQSMSQLNAMIDYHLETYISKSEYVYSNIELQRILTRRNMSVVDRIDDTRALMNILNPITRDTRMDIYVADTEQTLGGILHDNGSVAGEDWYEDLMKQVLHLDWTYYHDWNRISVIALSRELVDYRTLNHIGAFRLYMPVGRIEEILKNTVGDSGFSLLYMDSRMQTIASYGGGFERHGGTLTQIAQELPFSGTIEKLTVDNEEYLVGSVISAVNEFRLVYFVPAGVINERINLVTVVILIILSGTVGLCTLITMILSSQITKRVDVLIKHIAAIEGGDFKVKRRIKQDDELGRLEAHLHHMASTFEAYIQREYLTQILITRIKCELLQEQINPHLLYNTLAFLSYSAKVSQRPDLSGLVDRLSCFYKGVLNQGGITTSLKDELDMVKAYIDIVTVVYELSLTVRYDVDEDLLNNCSLKLLLQPLIENAIIHGIKPNKCGTLLIGCKRDGDEMILSVEDDGVGMKQSIVEMIISGAYGDTQDAGYALSNIIRRGIAFFGNSYKFNIDSSPWEGTAVRVTIPIMTKADMAKLMDEIQVNGYSNGKNGSDGI